MFSNKKVLLCVPNGSGSIPAIMVQSLLQLHKPCPCAFLVIERQRTDKCRDFFAKEMLRGGFDYLLMIDDDNPISPETLELMLEDDKDVVIAPILTRNPNKDGKHDLCAYYSRKVKIKDKSLRMYDFITKFKDSGYLHKIDAGGTGCMLIKRKVLEELAKKYEYIFEYGDITVNGQRRTLSEDVQFCERAVDNGFKIWLDERITPIHLGGQKIIKYVPMGDNNIK
jgi:GT2 family glycosyltransferase